MLELEHTEIEAEALSERITLSGLKNDIFISCMPFHSVHCPYLLTTAASSFSFRLRI